ncbi:MAG: cyclase family protein [Dehalococcoidia bacterium]|nr:cyclase family protein [Dehalococcoidia bacterium]
MHPHRRTLSYSRVIHLSHTIDPDIPAWPGDPPVEMDEVAGIANNGYFLRKISMGEHSATHMNAPAAFYENGAGIESYDASSLVAPAVVIHLAGIAGRDERNGLSAADIAAWEADHGPVPAGSLALVNTGWGKRWKDPVAYMNVDASGMPQFPGIDVEAARVLLEQRGATGLGIDSPGVDSYRDRDYSTNRMALAQRRIVLENLANLEQLPSTGATIFIGALRLRGGSGSPAAVLALVP